MKNKLILAAALLLLLPLASAYYMQPYQNSYYTYPDYQGYYEADDFQPYLHPRIIYDFDEDYPRHRSYARHLPSSYLPSYKYSSYRFSSRRYYDPLHYQVTRDYYDFEDFRRKALDVQYGSYEFFKAGYRAASNQEIAFRKGYNDGYYGKKAYFDDDHELTTWYREAYANGYYEGVRHRLMYEHPG